MSQSISLFSWSEKVSDFWHEFIISGFLFTVKSMYHALLHTQSMGRRLKEAWAVAKMNRFELRISSRIDVSQTWRIEYQFHHRGNKGTFHLLRLIITAFGDYFQIKTIQCRYFPGLLASSSYPLHVSLTR